MMLGWKEINIRLSCISVLGLDENWSQGYASLPSFKQGIDITMELSIMDISIYS